MLRAAVTALISPSPESSQKLLIVAASSHQQTRGRRRTLTPAPWLPPVYEKNTNHSISAENRELIGKVLQAERAAKIRSTGTETESAASIADIPLQTRRVGLIGRKIGMLPQWTNAGERILCTVIQVAENNILSVTSPEDWYRKSIVGKRKAFNREGPMWKVTVGAIDGNPLRYTRAYRNQFIRAGIPVKQHLGGFLVTEDALPEVGAPLDIRHFNVGQYITATGKSIDWGFQGGMHRWGMRGQPSRRTTKSHRRIGSVGSVGDARIWPGKRMPGHMGYEWVTVSGLQIVRMNVDKQVIYIKGSVPGDAGEIIQLKDCLQPEKKLKNGAMPTWAPSLETISEEAEEEANIPPELKTNEKFLPNLFRFTSPSIVFSDADAKKAAGRDKTKAKIAKVKK